MADERGNVLPAGSRYETLTKIASGGMATVYVGRLRGAEGFWRLVAIKRAHRHLVEDPAFCKMLVAEAKLASRLHHPNAVAVLDVEQSEDELLLVMDYVEGVSLAQLLSQKVPGPSLGPRVAVRIVLDVCAGLAAAHELQDDQGKPLYLVHRDVTPQNVLVGIDGVSRLTDFGIAKSEDASAPSTKGDSLKGKLGYMAPEYVEGRQLDARSDLFSLGVVLWESLTLRRLFRGGTEVETLKLVVSAPIPPVSSLAKDLGTTLDDVVNRVLQRAPGRRFSTARELADELERAARGSDLVAAASEVAELVKARFGSQLDERRALIQEHVANANRGALVEPPRSEASVGQAATEDPSSFGGASTRGEVKRASSRRWLVASGLVLFVLFAATAFSLSMGDAPAVLHTVGARPGAHLPIPIPSPSASSAVTPSPGPSASVVAPVRGARAPGKPPGQSLGKAAPNPYQ